MQNLYGLSHAELIQLAEDLSLPPYRGRQLFRHLYRHGQADFSGMTDLSASLRAELASRFRIAHPRVTESSESGDGAVKLLIELEDGLLVETVAIGSRRDAAGGKSGRAQGAGGEASDLTVCVSTQVGCPLACTFCRSGAIPFRRNLTAARSPPRYCSRNAPRRRRRGDGGTSSTWEWANPSSTPTE